jgi:hypothetical protein
LICECGKFHISANGYVEALTAKVAELEKDVRNTYRNGYNDANKAIRDGVEKLPTWYGDIYVDKSQVLALLKEVNG